MIDIFQKKRDLRLVMKDRRANAYAENPDAGSALCTQLLKHISLPSQAVVASYQAFGNEIDTVPLVEALRSRGHRIALPVVVGKGQALLFRCYEAGDQLAVGSFGMEEPLSSAPTIQPDVLLVPMLAFDRRLYRLGYGGGFYDRTLQQLRRQKRILALGVAFSCQEVLDVPHGTHDVRLDKITTELEAFP